MLLLLASLPMVAGLCVFRMLTALAKSGIFYLLRGVAQTEARLSWAQEVAGSSPVSPTKNDAAVAQLVEYRPSKPRVAGSIPVGRSSARGSTDRASDF